MKNSTHNRMILVTVTILLMSAICSPYAIALEESEHIIEVQQAIVDTGAGWTAGTTSVSGWTNAEKGRLTLTGEIPAPRGMIVSLPPIRTLQHESRYDCRDEGIVTSVKSQGSCGSCWAFGAIAVTECAFIKYGGPKLDLSEQHLISECCSAGNCDGGWPDWALDYIRDTGVPDETCYPYIAQDDGCDPCSGWEDRAYKIKDYVYVEPSTDDFKQALKEYGPIAVLLTVPDDWYYYRSGVYSPISNVGWANHAVLLTGWDDSDGCWIIKNSWGVGWGEQGYARVKYGDLEKYNYAYAITGIVDHGATPDPAGWFKPVGATASSEYNENYRAEKAIDNNTNTHWFGACGGDNPSITYDLGEVVTINMVRSMFYAEDLPITADITVSSDGVAWETVAESFVINNGSEYVEIPIEQSSCRYVRMVQTATARVYGTCTEFDVFCIADDSVAPIETTITITYSDGTNAVICEENIISIMLSQNGTKALEWWAPIKSVGG